VISRRSRFERQAAREHRARESSRDTKRPKVALITSRSARRRPSRVNARRLDAGPRFAAPERHPLRQVACRGHGSCSRHQSGAERRCRRRSSRRPRARGGERRRDRGSRSTRGSAPAERSERVVVGRLDESVERSADSSARNGDQNGPGSRSASVRARERGRSASRSARAALAGSCLPARDSSSAIGPRIVAPGPRPRSSAGHERRQDALRGEERHSRPPVVVSRRPAVASSIAAPGE
jgi:hypothetical protein